MQAETEGRLEDARNLFTEAWTLLIDDYKACVATHFLARSGEHPQDNYGLWLLGD